MADIIDKAEVKQIADSLNEIHEDLCEWDGRTAPHTERTTDVADQLRQGDSPPLPRLPH